MAVDGSSDYVVCHETAHKMGMVEPVLETVLETPTWTTLTRVHLEARLRKWGYRPSNTLYQHAMRALDEGYPYGIVVGAVEATRQIPPVPFHLAKVNQATLALVQLTELRRAGRI